LTLLHAPSKTGAYSLERRFEPEGIELPHTPASRKFTYATDLGAWLA